MSAATLPCKGTIVSWQSAFWSLVPAALNTMTQHSGRVCGLSAQFRTYIRLSPIFCAFDTVTLLIRLILYRIAGLPWCTAAREVKAARFNEEEVQTSEGGFQALENLTFVRWLLLGLGTLPQAVKMAALDGVPWTKAWLLSLLISFIVLETVFGMALWALKTDGDSETMEATSSEQQSSHHHHSQGTTILDQVAQIQVSPLGKVRAMRSNLVIMDGSAAGLAAIIHAIVLLWALHQLWYSAFDFSGVWAGHDTWRSILVLPPLGFYVVIILYVSALIIGIPGVVLFLFLKELPVFLALLGSFVDFLGCIFLVGFSVHYGLEILGNSRIEIMAGWFWELVVIALGLSTLSRVCWDLFAEQPLRTKLGLLPGTRLYMPAPYSTVTEDENNEGEAVAAFLGFVATVVLCLAWYQFRYDPAGTCKPGWADKLG